MQMSAANFVRGTGEARLRTVTVRHVAGTGVDAMATICNAEVNDVRCCSVTSDASKSMGTPAQVHAARNSRSVSLSARRSAHVRQHVDCSIALRRKVERTFILGAWMSTTRSLMEGTCSECASCPTVAEKNAYFPSWLTEICGEPVVCCQHIGADQ